MTDPRHHVIATFDRMIAGVPGVSRKGDTLPYVSVNGNMVASISKGDAIGLRLGPADLAAFEQAYGPSPFEALPGFFQKGYVTIPASVWNDAETLRSWFAKSHTYVAALKPKPTRR